MSKVRVESEALVGLLLVVFKDIKFANKAAISGPITRLVIKLREQGAFSRTQLDHTFEFTEDELTAVKEIKRIVKETYHE